jgi:hypothetical protein
VPNFEIVHVRRQFIDVLSCLWAIVLKFLPIKCLHKNKERRYIYFQKLDKLYAPESTEKQELLRFMFWQKLYTH